MLIQAELYQVRMLTDVDIKAAVEISKLSFFIA
jgi:hypothetical protein